MSAKIPRGDLTTEERERVRGRERRNQYLRDTGRAVTVPPDRAIAHVQKLHRRGMAVADMADQAGMSNAAVGDLVRGHRSSDKGNRPILRIARGKEAAILRVRFQPATRSGPIIDSTGTTRRLQALSRAGFSYPFLALRLGCIPQRISYIARSQKLVATTTALRVAALYEELKDADPQQLGRGQQSVSRTQAEARRKGWAPASCWDPDTIDDPEAIPEWTGQCGTVFGFYVHEDEGIPVCEPCLKVRGPRRRRVVPKFSPDKFRQARLRKGWTVAGLGREVGMDPTSISQWESGRSRPRPGGMIVPVMIALDVTYEEVCE